MVPFSLVGKARILSISEEALQHLHPGPPPRVSWLHLALSLLPLFQLHWASPNSIDPHRLTSGLWYLLRPHTHPSTPHLPFPPKGHTLHSFKFCPDFTLSLRLSLVGFNLSPPFPSPPVPSVLLPCLICLHSICHHLNFWVITGLLSDSFPVM